MNYILIAFIPAVILIVLFLTLILFYRFTTMHQQRSSFPKMSVKKIVEYRKKYIGVSYTMRTAYKNQYKELRNGKMKMHLLSNNSDGDNELQIMEKYNKLLNDKETFIYLANMSGGLYYKNEYGETVAWRI